MEMANKPEESGGDPHAQARAGTNGIGTENEKSLHSAIKKWYALSGDELEVRVDGFIIDIVRSHELIEVQTRNFAAIGKKLRKLIKNHCVRLVYPIAAEKWIVRINESGELVKKRKSPKKGKLIHLFDELIRIPDILIDDNLIIEVLLIKEEEIWCEDGKGSWRRRGVSLNDRRLLEVIGSIELKRREDLLRFLPEGLEEPFSNKLLSLRMEEPIRIIRKLTYCLRKSGLIRAVGKSSNELLFAVIRDGRRGDG